MFNWTQKTLLELSVSHLRNVLSCCAILALVTLVASFDAQAAESPAPSSEERIRFLLETAKASAQTEGEARRQAIIAEYRTFLEEQPDNPLRLKVQGEVAGAYAWSSPSLTADLDKSIDLYLDCLNRTSDKPVPYRLEVLRDAVMVALRKDPAVAEPLAQELREQSAEGSLERMVALYGLARIAETKGNEGEAEVHFVAVVTYEMDITGLSASDASAVKSIWTHAATKLQSPGHGPSDSNMLRLETLVRLREEFPELLQCKHLDLENTEKFLLAQIQKDAETYQIDRWSALSFSPDSLLRLQETQFRKREAHSAGGSTDKTAASQATIPPVGELVHGAGENETSTDAGQIAKERSGLSRYFTAEWAFGIIVFGILLAIFAAGRRRMRRRRN